MLTWDPDRPTEPVYTGLGWGSVSDQHGMNVAFRTLGMSLYSSRDARGGGPRIDELHPREDDDEVELDGIELDVVYHGTEDD